MTSDRRRACLGALAALWTLAAAVGHAAAEPRRYALAFGVSDYGEGVLGGALRTPIANAVAMSATLEKLGWIVLNNVESEQANPTVEAFRSEIERLGDADFIEESDVLLFFSGHGLTLENRNRILMRLSNPGDAKMTVQLDRASASIEDVIGWIAKAEPRRIILIIDACSDQGDAYSASVTKRSDASLNAGFGEVRQELLVLYSSSPGGYAFDVYDKRSNDQKLSGFTRVFIDRIAQDTTLLEAFLETRIEVERDSELHTRGYRQRPFVLHDAIDGTYRLRAEGGGAKTGLIARPSASWWSRPEICRTDSAQLAEALAHREDEGLGGGVRGQAARSCIIEAVKAKLGVARFRYESGNAVGVAEITHDRVFNVDDQIDKLVVIDDRGRRQQHRQATKDIEALEDALAENMGKKGWTISLRVYRPQIDDTDFVNIGDLLGR